MGGWVKIIYVGGWVKSIYVGVWFKSIHEGEWKVFIWEGGHLAAKLFEVGHKFRVAEQLSEHVRMWLLPACV